MWEKESTDADGYDDRDEYDDDDDDRMHMVRLLDAAVVSVEFAFCVKKAREKDDET